MPFRKGDLKPNGFGRRKGQPNKATFEVKEWCRSVLESDEYREAAARRIIEGTAPHFETLAYQYGYGKPINQHRISGDADEPLRVTFGGRYRPETDDRE